MKDVCNAHSSYFTKENMFLSNKAWLRYSASVIHMRVVFSKHLRSLSVQRWTWQVEHKSAIRVGCHALEAASFVLYPHTQHNAWPWPLYEDSGQGYGSGGYARHAHHFEVILSAS